MLTKASKRSRFTEKELIHQYNVWKVRWNFTELIAESNSFLRTKGLFRIFKTKTTSYDMKVTGPCIKTPQTAKNTAESLAELYSADYGQEAHILNVYKR
ncbi:hypothetical protein EUGRSUZ_G00668 [Eucalyptus grandis]|uniref:Uncharacterized protein n=2 Tax=Eucalyptus grandis TaxID=71139 RepID=A0ACC3K1Q7_EUCGR|nr:hypothetical protein EUGRSUZ_G00668 [Eucalyptus grandis]